MSTTIVIRDVPDPLHRRLRARAALEGVSVPTYIVRELEQALGRARRRDVIERIARQPEVTLDPPAAEIVREAREERSEELARRLGLERVSDEPHI